MGVRATPFGLFRLTTDIRPAWRLWLVRVLLAGGLAGALLVPLLASTYWIRVLTTIYMYAVVATGLNVIAGFTGYPAFGNVVYFGVGAYATAITMTVYRLPFIVGVAVGIGVSVLYVVVVGTPVLRLKGHYFAIATLALNEATRSLVQNLGFTGSGSGMSVPGRQGTVLEVNTYFYLLMLGLLVAAVVFCYWLSRSRFGYGCRAVRYDEEGAAACGIPTTIYKVTAWAASAVFTAVAGALYAHWFGFIEAPVVFDMGISVKAFVMMLLGGSGSVLGPLAGAFLVELVGLFAWSRFLTYHTAVLGFIIVLVVIFVPGGIASLAGRRLSFRTLLDNVRRSRV